MKPVLVPIMVALELEDREAFTGNFRRLEEVFYELPRNEAGFITVRQFAGALRDLNVFLTEKQAHGVFGAFDVDGTGMIDPQLFVKQVAFAAQNHFRTPPRARPPVAPVPVVAPSSVSMRMPPPVTLEEVEDLANQLEDKSAEAYALETQVKELQEALADRDCSIEQVEDKLRLLAQKEESKKGKVKKSDPETNELRYKIRQLEAQVKGLQEEVEDITGMRDKFGKEVKGLQRDKAGLIKQMKELAQEKEQLLTTAASDTTLIVIKKQHAASMKELKKQKAAADAAAQEAEERNGDLQMQLDLAMEAAQAAARGDYEGLTEQIEDLLEENTKLKRDVRSPTRGIGPPSEDLIKENARLRQELLDAKTSAKSTSPGGFAKAEVLAKAEAHDELLKENTELGQRLEELAQGGVGATPRSPDNTRELEQQLGVLVQEMEDVWRREADMRAEHEDTLDELEAFKADHEALKKEIKDMGGKASSTMVEPGSAASLFSATLDVEGEDWEELKGQVMESVALAVNVNPEQVSVISASSSDGETTTAVFEVKSKPDQVSDVVAALQTMQGMAEDEELELAGCAISGMSDAKTVPLEQREKERASPMQKSKLASSKGSSRNKSAQGKAGKTSWEVALDEMFKKYARQSSTPHGATFAEIAAASHGIDLTELAHLAGDHGLIPGIISLQKLKALYHQTCTKSSHKGKECLTRPDFQIMMKHCIDLAEASERETPPSLKALSSLREMAGETKNSSERSPPPSSPRGLPKSDRVTAREVERLKRENQQLEVLVTATKSQLAGGSQHQESKAFQAQIKALGTSLEQKDKAVLKLEAELAALRTARVVQRSPRGGGGDLTPSRAAGTPPRSPRRIVGDSSSSPSSKVRIEDLESSVKELTETLSNKEAQLTTLRGVMNKMTQAQGPSEGLVVEYEARDKARLKETSELEEALADMERHLEDAKAEAEMEREAKEEAVKRAKMSMLKEAPQMNQQMVSVMEELAAEADVLRAEKLQLSRALNSITPRAVDDDVDSRKLNLHRELEKALEEREETLKRVTEERDAALEAMARKRSLTPEATSPAFGDRMSALEEKLQKSPGNIDADSLAQRVAAMRNEVARKSSSPQRDEEADLRVAELRREIEGLKKELITAQDQVQALGRTVSRSPVREDGGGELRSRLWEVMREDEEGSPPMDDELLDILAKRGDQTREMRSMQAEREHTALNMAGRLDKFDSLISSNKIFLQQIQREINAA